MNIYQLLEEKDKQIEDLIDEKGNLKEENSQSNKRNQELTQMIEVFGEIVCQMIFENNILEYHNIMATSKIFIQIYKDLLPLFYEYLESITIAKKESNFVQFKNIEKMNCDYLNILNKMELYNLKIYQELEKKSLKFKNNPKIKMLLYNKLSNYCFQLNFSEIIQLGTNKEKIYQQK